MRRIFLVLAAFGLIVGLLTQLGQLSSTVYAEDPDPTEEEYIRKTTINVEYVAHEWWLVRWKDDEITCRFLVEHEGWPTADEVKPGAVRR